MHFVTSLIQIHFISCMIMAPDEIQDNALKMADISQCVTSLSSDLTLSCLTLAYLSPTKDE